VAPSGFLLAAPVPPRLECQPPQYAQFHVANVEYFALKSGDWQVAISGHGDHRSQPQSITAFLDYRWVPRCAQFHARLADSMIIE